MARVQSVKKSRGFERWLIVSELVIAVAIVGAIFGEHYDLFSTLLFLLCGLAFAYTGMSFWRMFTSLSDEQLEIRSDPIDEIRESLLREKRLLTEGLKELQSDYAAGKVDDADYDALKLSAENRALTVIKRLKNEDAKWLAAAHEAAGLSVPQSDTQAPAEVLQVQPAQPAQLAEPEPAPVVQGAPADRRIFPAGAAKLIASKCGHCGHTNPEDARFCINCGIKLEALTEAV